MNERVKFKRKNMSGITPVITSGNSDITSQTKKLNLKPLKISYKSKITNKTNNSNKLRRDESENEPVETPRNNVPHVRNGVLNIRPIERDITTLNGVPYVSIVSHGNDLCINKDPENELPDYDDEAEEKFRNESNLHNAKCITDDDDDDADDYDDEDEDESME